MFWGAICFGTRTDLVPMIGDLTAPRGGNTARIYMSLLQEYLGTIYEPGLVFIQDNAAIHKAKIMMDWLKEEGVWPSYPPDLMEITQGQNQSED
jgi:hypothetical protein